jgi:hypothetical protein
VPHSHPNLTVVPKCPTATFIPEHARTVILDALAIINAECAKADQSKASKRKASR